MVVDKNSIHRKTNEKRKEKEEDIIIIWNTTILFYHMLGIIPDICLFLL